MVLKDFFDRNLNIIRMLIMIIIILIIFALIFGINDLNITIKFMEYRSNWAYIISDLSYSIGYCITITAIVIFFGSYIANIKKQKFSIIFGILIGLFMLWYGLINNTQIIVFEGVGIIISLILITSLTTKINWNNYRTLSLIILLLVLLNQIIFIQITRIICGRIQFSDLNTNYSNYTPWFLPPGFNTKNLSFPSDHMSWIFLPFLILLKDYQYRKLIKSLLIILVFGWLFLAGTAVIIIGYNYPSDILFSVSSAAFITILLYNKLYLSQKYTTYYKFESRQDKGKYIYSKYNEILKGKILDVGCSRERSLEKELPVNVEYIGLDIVPEADLVFDLENLETLPFEDNYFDVVVCADVLEHIENIHRVLQEFVRISKYLIISLPNPWSGVWKAIIYNKIYSGSLKNDEKRWLKFYGLPDYVPNDRHKWFFSFSEAQIFFKRVAKRLNLEILQIDGEIVNISYFKNQIKKLVFNSFGIKINLSGGKYNKERERLIKDCCSSKIWILLKKK